MEEIEREVWVGDNRFYLGHDNILYITANVNFTGKIIDDAKEASCRLMKYVDGKVNVLTDLQESVRLSGEIRRNEYLENERLDRIAYFGLHPVSWLLAIIINGIKRKKNTRFFRTREEAITWLKM
jgi:hypothetical protein